MPFVAVSKLGINLIGKNHNIRSAKNFGNFFKMTAAHNPSRWVVRIGKDKQLCVWSNSLFQRFRSKAKVILLLGFDCDDIAAGKTADRVIADKAGYGKKHVVARPDNGTDCKVNGFRTADGNKNLVFRVIVNVDFAL